MPLTSQHIFLTSCNITVPYFTIVLRKAYGLGKSAMVGGNYRAPYFYVSWPAGEFAPTGIEGQVKLGFCAELAAIADPAERRKFFEDKVAKAYEAGKALNRSTNSCSTTRSTRPRRGHGPSTCWLPFGPGRHARARSAR